MATILVHTTTAITVKQVIASISLNGVTQFGGIAHCGKEQRMSKHICDECKHHYFMLYRDGMKCMNEKSERYAEDIASGDTCEEWEDRRTDNETD